MGTIQIRTSDLALPPVSLAGGHQAFTRGVTGKTGEMVVVMDLVTLARDPRVTVNEEVV
jgi:hypothetical protein